MNCRFLRLLFSEFSSLWNEDKKARPQKVNSVKTGQGYVYLLNNWFFIESITGISLKIPVCIKNYANLDHQQLWCGAALEWVVVEP